MPADVALSTMALRLQRNQILFFFRVLSGFAWRLNLVTDLLIIPVAPMCVVSCRTIAALEMGLSELLARSMHSSCFVKYLLMGRSMSGGSANFFMVSV